MSRDISTTEKVRLSWVTELRRQGHRQCHGTGRAGFGGVCAMELLREITDAPQTWTLGDVGPLAGLSIEQVFEVIRMSDGRCGFRKHTFSEIADVVEGWFR